MQYYNITPIIIDNKSNDKETISLLRDAAESSRAEIVYCSRNFGHMVCFLWPHYEVLPEVFALSDPDLQFSSAMPRNFLEILSDLTRKYRTYKAGLALPIDPKQDVTQLMKQRVLTYPFPYQENLSLRQWESQHARFQLADDDYILYAADIDTTFAVYRKSNYMGKFFDGIRVGGDFSAIHLPWFPALDPMGETQRRAFLVGNRATSWVR